MPESDLVESQELQRILTSRLSQWTRLGKELERTIEFVDFRSALEFVNAVAEKAELMGHHPDLDIRYNKVTALLTSHEAGGVTWQDIALASHIDHLAPKYQARKIA